MNAYQYALTYSGWLSWAACFLSALLILQGWKLFFVWGKWLVLFVRLALLKFDTWNLILITIFSFSFYLGRFQVADLLKWVEQKTNPLYLVDFEDQTVCDIYEKEMAKHLTVSEVDTVRARTKILAQKIGSTPSRIYEVVYSECGMNVFCVRKDGIAAGMLQFTRAGLTGLGYSLDQVKTACEKRDTRLIMDLSEAYLISRAKGRPLTRSCDVYTAVFAPGYIGCPDEQVLYSEKDGAAYTLNSGLDGYYINGKEICYGRKMQDGKITIEDLRLALEAKKAKLCKRIEL